MAFGLSSTGFKVKRQSDIQTEIQASLKAAFGTNINLLPESVFGQLVGIFSEREALVWELGDAIYASQYPAGAEGLSVDNILALNGLKRLVAAPSTSKLTLYGTPGTLIPAGSLIHVLGQVGVQFATDIDATIAVAVDAIQSLAFTAVPDSGHFTLSIVSPAGDTLTTGNIQYSDNAAFIQAAIRALTPGSGTPYDDVTVTGSFAIGFTINFLVDSGAQSQHLFTTPANTLKIGATNVNINVIDTQEGSVPKIEVASTCTQDGPNAAGAGTITEIDSPTTGWSSVTNLADAITGRNTETDTEALQRRADELAASANGSLQGITTKVKLLDGVSTAIGFENTSIFEDMSTQFVKFSGVPLSGVFKIRLGGSPGDSTANINYNDSAAQIQTKITAVSGYSGVTVTGTFATKFIITFPVNFFGQPILAITSSTLTNGGGAVTSTVTGGRDPKSFEIVVEGGDDSEIATTIFDNKPAGIESFGNSGPFTVTDEDGFTHSIYFSRPTLIPIFISITLVTNSDFPVDGVKKIQDELVAIGSAFKIGETVIVFGTNGLMGAFNDIPGISSYTLYADKVASPSSQANIQMQDEQLATVSAFNILVTVT